MEKGWIKLHRRILENDFLMHDDKAYIVFTKLLMLAGKERGSWSGGRRQLAKIFEMNDRTLYGVLIRLQDNGIIDIESKVKYSVLTIKNWSTYQQNADRGEDEIATEDATLAQQGSIPKVATAHATRAQPQRNHTATTAQHSNKNKERRIKNTGEDFLELVNRKFGRNFQVMPVGAKETLDKFGLEKIEQAYDVALNDSWYSERKGSLSSGYLMRKSTIDNLLNRKSTNSQADWLQQIKEASNAS